MVASNLFASLIMTETLAAYDSFMNFHGKKDNGLSFLDLLLETKEFNTINYQMRGKSAFFLDILTLVLNFISLNVYLDSPKKTNLVGNGDENLA